MAQLFPEPTPLEAIASIEKLAGEASAHAKTAARMNDWRVVRYWRAEYDRLRALRFELVKGDRQ